MKQPFSEQQKFYKTREDILSENLTKQRELHFSDLPVCPTVAYPNSNSVIQFLGTTISIRDLDTFVVTQSIGGIAINVSRLFAMNQDLVAGLCDESSILRIWSFNTKQFFDISLSSIDPEKIVCFNASVFVVYEDNIVRCTIDEHGVSKEVFNTLAYVQSLTVLEDGTLFVTCKDKRQDSSYYIVSKFKVNEVCIGASKVVVTPQKTIYELRNGIFRKFNYHNSTATILAKIPESVRYDIENSKLTCLTENYLLVTRTRGDINDLTSLCETSTTVFIYNVELGKVTHNYGSISDHEPNVVLTSKGSLLMSRSVSFLPDTRVYWLMSSFSYNLKDEKSLSEKKVAKSATL